MERLEFGRVEMPAAAEAARQRIRAFLADELAAGRFQPHQCTWSSFDADFSRRLGAAGFIGVTWPTEYGGQNASSLTRFVITEELLAAGSPCGAHWIADRQSGPQILQHGSERAKREIRDPEKHDRPGDRAALVAPDLREQTSWSHERHPG